MQENFLNSIFATLIILGLAGFNEYNSLGVALDPLLILWGYIVINIGLYMMLSNSLKHMKKIFSVFGVLTFFSFNVSAVFVYFGIDIQNSFLDLSKDHESFRLGLFLITYLFLIIVTFAQNRNKATNDLMSLLTEIIILTVLGVVALTSSEGALNGISWWILCLYFVTKSIISTIFKSISPKNSRTFSYLVGKREEIDKELSLFFVSFILWLVYEIQNSAEISDLKSIEQVLLLLTTYSFILLLFSWLKYILRFNDRDAIKALHKESFDLNYHRGYSCDISKHETTIQKIFLACCHKMSKLKLLGAQNECNKLSYPYSPSEKGIFEEYSRLTPTDRGRYSTALYEIGKSKYQECNDDREEVLEHWQLFFEQEKKEEEDTDVFNDTDARLLNDYWVLRVEPIEEKVSRIKKENKKSKEREEELKELNKQIDGFSILLESAVKCDETIAKYNLARHYHQRKCNSSRRDELLQQAMKGGYQPAAMLFECILDDNDSDVSSNYEISISETRIGTIYQQHNKKPVEIFVGIFRILFVTISIYLTLLILQHPKAEIFGISASSLGFIGIIFGVIFNETARSFFSGIRIYLDDLARIGDRVELKDLNIHGRVNNFSLTNITILNFDHSLVHLSLTEYINASVLNWRLLDFDKGRRIRRNFLIDARSIEVYVDVDGQPDNDKLFDRLMMLKSLDKFIDCKKSSFYRSNNNEFPSCKNNQEDDKSYRCLKGCTEGYPDRRFITNLGLFRAFIEQYLHDHQFIDNKQSIIVSTFSPTEIGVPVEIFAYTQSSDEFTSYKEFSVIKSDIFEHIIGSAPFFGLEFFQSEKDSQS